MQKVKPDLYRKFTPAEYKVEFDRIENEINKMDNFDFEIIINTDIPFRCEITKMGKRPFTDLTDLSFNIQKGEYIHYLKMMFMFPANMYQRN